MLYSGSTITTAINNIANIAIGVSIAECEYKGELDICTAAERAGYIITGCQPLEYPEDIQFLKHSPIRDIHGVYQPMLNFGVLIRASGTCKGDLPGRGPLIDRAQTFQRSLLRSAYPKTNFRFLDIMKSVVGVGETYIVDDFCYKVVDKEEFPPYTASDDSIRLRYRLDDLDYAEICEFASCGYSQFMHNYGISKILQLDYGLSTTQNDGAVYQGIHSIQER
jgi:hypothetical protein